MNKRKFFAVVFLFLEVTLLSTGCATHHAKDIIEKGLSEKYGEPFIVSEIKQEKLFIFGGFYFAEAFSESEPDRIVKVEYHPDAETKILDTYQNEPASVTMTTFDRQNLEGIFGLYNYDSKCTVRLNWYPLKIDTENVQEIKAAAKIEGTIIYCSYFVVETEAEVEKIKKQFENHLEYFSDSGENVLYSIAFCDKSNEDMVKKYFKSMPHWRETDSYLYGYYEIQNTIQKPEDLEKTYVIN